jgi:hypothetical protein
VSIKIIIATFFAYFLTLAILDTLMYFAYKNDKESLDDTYYIISNTFINRFKWIIMYYFVIQVNSVVIKLKATDTDSYFLKLHRWESNKTIIYTLLIIFQIGIATTRLFDKLVLKALSVDKQNDIPLLICAGFKLCVFILDIIMFKLFIGIVRFYNGQRRNANRWEENKVKYKSVNETIDKNEKQNDSVNLKKKHPQTNSW